MRRLAFLLLGLTVLLSFSACEKDEDDDINFLAEYTGSWECRETSGLNAPQVYTVTIERGSNDQEIIINRLYNSTSTAVRANINGFNFTIPQQTSGGFSFSGTGTADADFQKINMVFTANDGSGDDKVNAILAK